MKRGWISILLCLGACGRSPDPVVRGRGYFASLGCTDCHRIAGRGGGQVGPDLTFTGFRQSPAWMDRWLQDPTAWKPGTAMPNLKIPPSVRADLIAYLQTLRGEAYRAEPPWNGDALMKDTVRRGETLFVKAGCEACHGPAGAGGHPNNNVVGGKIPALTLTADGYTKEELKALLRQGRRPTPADPTAEAPLVAMPAWGEVLTEDEIAALVDYVYSLRPAKTADDDWAQ